MEREIFLLGKVMAWSSLEVDAPAARGVPLNCKVPGCIGLVLAFDDMDAAVEAADDGDRIITMYSPVKEAD